MAQPKGPTWEQLTEQEKMAVDHLFRTILRIKARKGGGAA